MRFRAVRLAFPAVLADARVDASAYGVHVLARMEAFDVQSIEEVIAGIRRERDKMRQRNSRLARKYGLKGRRERG